MNFKSKIFFVFLISVTTVFSHQQDFKNSQDDFEKKAAKTKALREKLPPHLRKTSNEDLKSFLNPNYLITLTAFSAVIPFFVFYASGLKKDYSFAIATGFSTMGGFFWGLNTQHEIRQFLEEDAKLNNQEKTDS